MHTLERAVRSTPEAPDLEGLFGCVFDSLLRTDQRRWAEFYVTGLATVPGRKSIPRMAEVLGAAGGPGSVVQCLQQFVSQSPWAWQPVRRALVQAMTPAVVPKAWVVQETEFVKDGRSSVGVCSQYAPGLRRVVNCQLACTVWMAGTGGWVPANWRLMLPQIWDADEERRTKVRLPDTERHRPVWAHILNSIDEMVTSWGQSPQPVVADRCHDERHLESLVAGLEERGLQYLIRVTERAPIIVHRRTGTTLPAAEVLRAVQEVIPLPVDSSRSGRGCAARVGHAVIPTDRMAPTTTRPMLRRPRRLLALRPQVGRGPGVVWYTNMAVAGALNLLSVLDVDANSNIQLAMLRNGSGLDHFEGRSFRGWHHHVTLASVAHSRTVAGAVHAPPPRALRLAQ